MPQEPSTHRVGFGPRLAALMLVPLLIAACQGGAPTPGATTTPPAEATPSATPTATTAVPSTPTAIPRATPTAKPSLPAGAVTIDGLIADIKAGGSALDKYRKPISVSQLTMDFEAMMASPAGASSPTNIRLAFQDCVGSGGPSGIINACGITTTMTFRTIAITSTLEALKFAQDMADHDIATVFTTLDDHRVLLQMLEATIGMPLSTPVQF